MAERIVSPGVFTQERDQTFLAQGVAEIGAAFVGPTTKGPAFIPTLVDGEDGFVRTFGQPDGTSYLGYAVKNYLQEAGSATIVRVLGLSGYQVPVATIYASGSSGRKILAVLHPTISGSTVASASAAGTGDSFSVLISGSANNTTVSASGLSPVQNLTNYIGEVFGSNPQSTTRYPAYAYTIFPNAISQASASSANVTISASISTLTLTNAFSNAKTPWIISQPIAGTTHRLFRVHTLGDGTITNKDIKISIVGISPSTNSDSNYGSFTLMVRAFNDTDKETNILEQYDVTLDPNSSKYIGRVIGTAEKLYNSTTGEYYIDGDFPNVSKYIRIEMATGDTTPPDVSLPYGFEALLSTVPNAGSTELASGSYVTSRWNAAGTGSYTSTNPTDYEYMYGFNFSTTNNDTNLSYLGPTIGSNTVGSNFNISSSVSSTEVLGSAISLTNPDHVKYRQFSVPFQGGFDGLNPARFIAIGSSITSANSQGFNLTNALSSGSVEYKRALDQLSNPDNVDLNLLIVPGIIYSAHSYIAQYGINLCQTRGDCFYILDLNTLDTPISDVITSAQQLDTNYAASYYPWVRVYDADNGKYLWAPPSVVLPEVYKYSDNVGAEWFAPAGLNRGGIPGAVSVRTRLNQSQRDTLYESKVNPIAQFPGQGICVWGQKTLQRRASALDRVNVRRLLITVKKYIASSARYLVFEQNTEATRQRFLNIVNPYLANIQQNSGLTAFRVVMDETNNTPDIIDRNILVGAIYLQPTRTAEFIKLDFNILPTGATFDTI